MKGPASRGLIRSAIICGGFLREDKLWWWNYVKCTAVVLLALQSAENKVCSLTAVRSWQTLISWTCNYVSYLSPVVLLVLHGHPDIQITTPAGCFAIFNSPNSQLTDLYQHEVLMCQFILRVYIQYIIPLFKIPCADRSVPLVHVWYLLHSWVGWDELLHCQIRTTVSVLLQFLQDQSSRGEVVKGTLSLWFCFWYLS